MAAGSGHAKTDRSPKRRRIAVITGTRAEYGLLTSTMRAIDDHPRLRLQLVVTGMHLLPRFGRTIEQIRRDGWRIDATVAMHRGNDSPLDCARGLARGVAGIAEYVHGANSDIVVVLGDRVEALAGGLAAVTTGKLLAHIHGGDRAAGDLDDSFRHAVTKLAHVHLAATRSAAARIRRMGEDGSRIHWVGAPGLDRLRELLEEGRGRRGGGNGQSARAHASCRADRRNRLPVGGGRKSGRGAWTSTAALPGSLLDQRLTIASRQLPRALLVQHPCGRPAAHEQRVMRAILEAVSDVGLSTTCIYPNSDRGHSGIIRAIEVYARRVQGGGAPFCALRSLDRDNYLRLLIGCDVLIGNSSSGIIEAAIAGTPAVNIGPRQTGREASAQWVVHCGETRPAIVAAIRSALRKGPIKRAQCPYGEARAGARIAAILASVPLSTQFRHKLNAY